MSLFMETTEISASQTVGEIQRLLGRYGAKSIQVEYDAGEVSAVSFVVEISGNRVPFALPCRWKAVYASLFSKKKSRYSDKDIRVREAKAKRVAWRQILRWVEAQLALVETKMVNLEEVFMPYIVVDEGLTLYQKIANDQFLLDAPK